MKKLYLLTIILTILLVGCGNKKNDSSTKGTDSYSKSIVIYFSRTNNTEKIANYIIDITNSDKYEIEAKTPYTNADINYNDSNSRTSIEQNDSTCRPEIGSSVIDLTKYDVIYLGYPIWWGQAPKIMYTFVESYDLSNKTIIPFCTSGSSEIGSSATNLEKSTNNAKWLSGKRFDSSSSKNDVKEWIDTINLGG